MPLLWSAPVLASAGREGEAPPSELLVGCITGVYEPREEGWKLDGTIVKEELRNFRWEAGQASADMIRTVRRPDSSGRRRRPRCISCPMNFFGRSAVSGLYHRVDDLPLRQRRLIVLHLHTVGEKVHRHLICAGQLRNTFFHPRGAGGTGHARHIKILFQMYHLS